MESHLSPPGDHRRYVPMTKTVLICGAGSTLNESRATRVTDRPPLDRGFFKVAKRVAASEFDAIASYLDESYSIDPTSREFDSLEQMMAILYSDVHNPAIRGASSIVAFRALLKLINSRIAETTNSIRPTKYSALYRILRNLLLDGVSPSDISIITFNYDLIVEKVIFKLQQSSSVAHLRPLSIFPACYRLGRFRNSNAPRSSAQFPRSGAALSGIEILKLHGSLNY